MKWAWGLSLTTMSTGCCMCGRWIPAHDSLYVRKAPAGVLDDAACESLCGAGARCFDATAMPVSATEPQLMCFGDTPQDVWMVSQRPAPAATPAPSAAPSAGPTPDAAPPMAAEPEDEPQVRPECAPCAAEAPTIGGHAMKVRDCAPLTDQVTSGERMVVCFRHNDGECVMDQPAGRHAVGIEKLAPEASPDAGAYFARLAHAERASVLAFRALARDLARFGAPKRLVRGALRSAREEERHHLAMKRLAKRHGAVVAPVTGTPRPHTTLRDLALENAVEGCVREAFAAELVARQAEHAADPAVRRAFSRIAPEELAHAELSAKIHRFVERRLEKDDISVIRFSMRDAQKALASS
ncbi:MAG: ferritin-like domain-containing protein [Polyangiaceae bacterium]|nr:ferritin-like domain-containing protein [Polyangiaceae bacterium]